MQSFFSLRFFSAALISIIAFALPDSARAQTTLQVHRAINIARWFTWPRYEKAPGAGIMWPPYTNTPVPPTERELKELREAGFDTIRLPVDPAPFMAFEGKQREDVYGILLDAVRRIRSAGLQVIVDLHPNSRHPVWGQHAVTRGLDAPLFITYASIVEEMARRLAPLGKKQIALELMNEPRLKCKDTEQNLWQQMLKQMIGRARAGSAAMTLVVTGACVSSADGLMALDPEVLNDRNIIYTFHFYDPFSFTHQGAQFIPWPDKYLDEVPWPANARPIEKAEALIAQNVAADPKLDGFAREKAKLGAERNLQKLYATNAGADTIEHKFAEVANWAKENGLAGRQILVGEFGVLRKLPNKRGALCEDRMRWLADVRQSAERHGFAWSYFSYDGPFALIHSDNDRRLDQPTLASLGLKHRNSECKN